MPADAPESPTLFTQPREAVELLARAAARVAEAVDAIERSGLAQGLREAAEAVDRLGLARMLSISVRGVDDLNNRGLIPEPVQIGDRGRCPRWLRREIVLWLIAGAPTRLRWTHMRRSMVEKLAC